VLKIGFVLTPINRSAKYNFIVGSPAPVQLISTAVALLLSTSISLLGDVVPKPTWADTPPP